MSREPARRPEAASRRGSGNSALPEGYLGSRGPVRRTICGMMAGYCSPRWSEPRRASIWARFHAAHADWTLPTISATCPASYDHRAASYWAAYRAGDRALEQRIAADRYPSSPLSTSPPIPAASEATPAYLERLG
jgi:hypothetical protein